MDNRVNEIITQHIVSDKIIESVSITDDFKTHNREMRKLSKLVLSISHETELCKMVYSQLLKSENAVTLLNASSECLKLNLFVKQAKKNLHILAKRKDNGIISFNAEMMLAEWNETNK